MQLVTILFSLFFSLGILTNALTAVDRCVPAALETAVDQLGSAGDFEWEDGQNSKKTRLSSGFVSEGNSARCRIDRLSGVLFKPGYCPEKISPPLFLLYSSFLFYG